MKQNVRMRRRASYKMIRRSGLLLVPVMLFSPKKISPKNLRSEKPDPKMPTTTNEKVRVHPASPT
jgi:hypothetical protein